MTRKYTGKKVTHKNIKPLHSLLVLWSHSIAPIDFRFSMYHGILHMTLYCKIHTYSPLEVLLEYLCNQMLYRAPSSSTYSAYSSIVQSHRESMCHPAALIHGFVTCMTL